ncbi:MAG: hypothetical protein FD156_955 [Nitrospirae bacterium]|nr:MAG: hypothetical protein FD156_955 [Nitrospirota bacterium]
MLQKIYVKTFQAFFATETLAIFCLADFRKEELKMIFRQTKVELLITVVLFPFLFGCSTYYVGVIQPQAYQYESKVPLNAAFYMKDEFKHKKIYGVLGATRVKKTGIPIGDFVYKYSISYLKGGFTNFNVTDTPGDRQSFFISVSDINSRLGHGNYDLFVTYTIKNSKGIEVFNKKYYQTGQLNIPLVSLHDESAVIAEAVQKYFHFSLEKILLELMDDIQQNYKKWAL